MKKSIFLCVICIAMMSCKNQEQVSSGAIPFYVGDAIKKYEIDFIDFSVNNDKSLVLVSYTEQESLNPATKYTIYDLNSKQEVYSNAFIGESVRWYSTNEVILKGISQLEPKSKTIINVKTGESRSN